MAMIQVSADRAMQSPYYGIKGWLLVIYVLSVLSMLSSVSNVISALMADQAGSMGLTGIDPTMMAAMNTVHLVLALPFLILTPMKHRLMPMVSIACLWISVAVTLAFFLAYGSAMTTAMEQQMQNSAGQSGSAMPADLASAIAGFGMLFGVAVAIVFSALVTWFLLASKRVNATFRHRLPGDMADMPATGIPSHG